MFALLFFVFLFQTPAAPNDVGPIVAMVVARALALTPIVKIAVDVLAKSFVGLQGKAIWLVAAVTGMVIDALFVAVTGAPFSVKVVALTILTGIASAGGSIAVTQVHDAVRP